MRQPLPNDEGCVRSKAAVLSFLIVAPMSGFCVYSMFCCTLLCVLSSFAIILMGKRGGCFTLFVFLVPCVCYVALPYGARGRSAVCDCGISLSYSLAFCMDGYWA